MTLVTKNQFVLRNAVSVIIDRKVQTLPCEWRMKNQGSLGKNSGTDSKSRRRGDAAID
jgi:hypothetical protein